MSWMKANTRREGTKPFAIPMAVLLWGAVLAAGSAAFAQEPTPQGRWDGKIQTPGPGLGVIVDLAQSPDSAWAGKISIPAQRLKDFSLSNVKVDGRKVSFAMAGVPANPRFKGGLSEDGGEISGDFSQGGGHFTFKLKRKGDVPAPPPPIEGIPGEGLAGLWLGRLDAGPVSLRLLFRISADEQGVLTGTLDNLDQGAMGLKISEIEFEDESVRIKLAKPAALFEGTMSDDGSEIVGKWRQNRRSTPLTIKRQAEAPDLARSQDPERPYPYRDEEVVFRNERAALKLAGTLTLPRGKGPFPAGVLISGSGPQDRNETVMGHRPFLVLADHLTRNGLAVLRYDDRGVGGSEGSVSQSTTEDFAGDSLAAVSYLKTRQEIDQARIGLLGPSEGATAAAIAAAQSAEVAFLVLVAPPGVNGEQIVYRQSVALATAMGVDESQVESIRKAQQRLFEVVSSTAGEEDRRETLRAMQQMLYASLSEIEKQALGVGSSAALEAQAKMLLTPWFRFFLAYDPAEALRKVRCPTLALFGERDVQVPIDQNLPPLEEALGAAPTKDYRAVRLPKLNHLMQTSESGLPAEYARIEETISPRALKLITGWIIERTRRGPTAASARAPTFVAGGDRAPSLPLAAQGS